MARDGDLLGLCRLDAVCLHPRDHRCRRVVVSAATAKGGASKTYEEADATRSEEGSMLQRAQTYRLRLSASDYEG